MKRLLKTLKNIAIGCLFIAIAGCDENQEIKLPDAIAEYTYTINQQTGFVRFINTSTNAVVFNWSFGNGQTSSEINPSHTFEPGTYTVTLEVENKDGSLDSFESVIVIGDTDHETNGDSDCTTETTENIDPANGDLNISFLTNNLTHTFEAFGNTAGQIVSNPVLDDLNSSCQVEQFVKASGCETWSGLGFELSTALDFTTSSTNKKFTMKVLAENQVSEVTLRLERLPHPNNEPAIERVATITQVGAWQELTFDFTDVSTGTYKNIIVYFERNTSCDGDVYYFDDLKQLPETGGTGGVITACTTETTENIDPSNGDLNISFLTNNLTHTFEAFGNTAGQIVSNPVLDDLNSSCQVEQFVKTSGCETWSGLGFELNTALDFTTSSTNKKFAMKVLAENQVSEVTLRLERLPHPNNEPAIERVATITQVGAWQELTFDFTDVSTGTYKNIIVYFERNMSCDGDVYYFDDLKQLPGTGGDNTGGNTGVGSGGGCSGSAVGATAFPVNFESCESFTSSFTDVGSITTSLDNNPSKTGVNTSDYVLRVDKNSGTNKWAGFQNPFPNNFDATKTFKVKVYSTVANVVMRFEVNSDPQDNASGNPGPQFATISNANTWTEVEIIFTGIPDNNTGLNQFVIKPNNPLGSDADFTSSNAIYYFDDFRLE